MSDGIIQLPADSTGKKLATADFGSTLGHKQQMVLSDPATNAAQASVMNTVPAGTEYGAVTRAMTMGMPISSTTGSFTSGSAIPSYVTATNVGTAGNITVTISGTYGANAVLNFEVSDDSGTTWYPMTGARADGTGAESTTLALPANTLRMWDFPCAGINQFRVRLSVVPASGTLAVRITPSSMIYDPIPTVAIQPPRADQVVIKLLATASATADTLYSLVKMTNYVDAGGATSISAAAGKTLYITAASFTVRAGAATAAFAEFTWRVNPTGATILTSPTYLRQGVGSTAAVSGAVIGVTITFPNPVTFSGTQTLGISSTAQATTNVLTAELIGYEA